MDRDYTLGDGIRDSFADLWRQLWIYPVVGWLVVAAVFFGLCLAIALMAREAMGTARR